jgi:hypothetical protein
MANFWQEVKKAFVEEPHPKSVDLEKKVIGRKEMSILETNKLIDQIHDEFYTEVDKLLEFAKILKPLDTDKQEIIDKAKRLEKLGFKNTKDSDLARKEKQRLNDLQVENSKKQELKEAILYFSNKYPLYKFITEDSVKKICEKYNLTYGEVNFYRGDVPDKNLKEIENFKVDKEDLVYRYYDTYTNLERTNYSYEEIKSKLDYKWVNDTDRYKLPLEIAAPLKDFNSSGMEVKDFKLSKIEIPDPIVLQPVLYNHTKHYLIVTAWGQEAIDPLVLNPKFN